MSALRSAFKSPAAKKGEKKHVSFGTAQTQEKPPPGKRSSEKSSQSAKVIAEKRSKLGDEFTESIKISCEQNETAQMVQELETKVTKQHAQYWDFANEVASFTKSVSDLSSKAQKFETFLSEQNEALHDLGMKRRNIIESAGKLEEELKEHLDLHKKWSDIVQDINTRMESLPEMNIDPNNMDQSVLEEEIKQISEFTKHFDVMMSHFITLTDLC